MVGSVRIVELDEVEHATGAVVVVDVLRAFTTATVAFAAGVRELHAVATVEEAFAVRATLDGALLAGEDGGMPVPGFDLDNSPSRLRAALRTGLDLRDRVLVQRTSAGTQGLVRAQRAEVLLAASFACAGATVRHLRGVDAETVTLVVTGTTPAGSRSPFPGAPRDGDEDRACAEYLAALLAGEGPAPETYLDRVRASTAGRWFADPSIAHYPTTDLEVACELDVLDRALVAGRRDGRAVLTPG